MTQDTPMASVSLPMGAMSAPSCTAVSKIENNDPMLTAKASSVPGRPGIRVIAKQFGVSPMTVHNVAN